PFRSDRVGLVTRTVGSVSRCGRAECVLGESGVRGKWVRPRRGYLGDVLDFLGASCHENMMGSATAIVGALERRPQPGR
ncbi:hypothetical protein EV363DRAFT_1167638, partial [Boletus edulis]